MINELVAVVTLVAASASAAVINITPGVSALSYAITNNPPGSEIVLAPGVYVETAYISVDKAVTVRSQDPDNMAIIQGSTPVLFGITDMAEFKLEDVQLQALAGGTICSLEEPIALTGDFNYKLFPPVTMNSAGTMKMGVANGALNVVGSIGNWFNTRVLADIEFDECDYAGGKIIAPFVDVLATCDAELGFSVDFTNFAICGVVETEYPTMNSYESDLKIWFDEYVTMVDETKPLRIAVNRTGTAMTHLKMEIDRVANIAATIEPKWPYAELEAAITSVDVQAISENVSTIQLQVNVPSPYTVPSGSSGEVLFNQTDDGEMVTGAWSITEQCNGLDSDVLCTQTITFDITACDLSGLYYIFGLEFTCIEEDSQGNPLECPTILGDADLFFAIDTNDLCDDVFQLEALFTPTITLRPDETYVGVRPDDIFSLGEMSYWTIHLWTNESGVGFDFAEVIKIVRTSDNMDCSGFAWFGDDIGVDANSFSQTFKSYGPLTFPAADIDFPLLVTADMACARADSSGSSLLLNFTVLGDYMDNSGLRRRRSLDHVVSYSDFDQVHRRESGEATVEGEAGVLFTAEDFASTAATGGNIGSTAAATDESNIWLYLTIAGILVVLCVCCCCCAVAGVVVYRRRKANKPQQFEDLHSHSIMSMGNASAIGMNPQK
eukprot:CFRG8255T1